MRRTCKQENYWYDGLHTLRKKYYEAIVSMAK